MTETERAYDWARNQKFPSVAARNARLLAAEIERLQAPTSHGVYKQLIQRTMPEGLDSDEQGVWLNRYLYERDRKEWTQAANIKRLEAELTTRTKAARHVACMLGGAGDQSSGAWTRDDLRKLFKFVCAEYPWMDPRNQEAAEAKGGE